MGNYEDMTKEELIELAESRNIELSASDKRVKQGIIDKLRTADEAEAKEWADNNGLPPGGPAEEFVPGFDNTDLPEEDEPVEDDAEAASEGGLYVCTERVFISDEAVMYEPGQVKHFAPGVYVPRQFKPYEQ